jgi:ABC-type nitrate/sulfonate/bicarbonate transport system substrate-binding protein
MATLQQMSGARKRQPAQAMIREKRMKHLMAGILVGAFAATAPGAAGAQQLTPISMISFGGATNLPAWAAVDKGFFEKEGLKVTITQTAGSAEQFRDLMAGKYQFASTAFDNIVAYTEGQGAAKFDDFDVKAILGVHSGLNSVLSRPEIKTFADIKGKTVSVDALTSGYATVLYQILQNKGIVKDRDYKIITVGNTDARMKSLRDNTAQMAIISSPQDLQAQREGYNILADAAVEVGDYQGSAYALRLSWAKAHEKEALGLTRAIIAATDWVYANKPAAVEVLKGRVKGMSDVDLSAIYDRMIGPGGLNPHAEINLKGVETVLKLRSVYGEAKGPTPDVKRYVDTSFEQRAKAGK